MRINRIFIGFSLLCTICFFIIALLSCTSFPVPESDNDSLIIFPVDVVEKVVDGKKVVNTFGYLKLFIESEDGTFKKKVDLYSGYKYKAVVLPAGDMVVKGIQFQYKESSRPSGYQDLDLHFTGEPGTLFILARTFVFVFSAEGNRTWINTGIKQTFPADRVAIINGLKEEPNFRLWINPYSETGQ